MRTPRRSQRSVAVGIAVVVATAAWAGPVTAADPTSARAATVAAAAPTSAWYMATPEGPLTSDNATFTSFAPPPGRHYAQLRATASNNFPYEIYLEGPDATPIAPGVYADATGTPQAGHPFLFTNFSCLDSGGSFVVHEVTFAADGSVTQLAADYTTPCQLTDSSGAVRFNSSWPVKAIQPIGNSVDLGEVQTGTPAHATVTLRSVGTLPLTVSALTIGGPGASAWSIAADGCSGIPVAPGDSCSYDVVVSPSTSGDLDAGVFVHSDAVTPDVRTTSLHAHGQIATTTTIVTSPTLITAGNRFSIRASVSPQPEGGRFDISVDGGSTYFWTVYLNPGQPMVVVDLGPIPVGAHTMRALFVSATNAFAGSDSGTDTFYVGDATTTTISTNRTSVYGSQPPTITASVAGPTGLTGGTLTITDYTTMSVLGSIPVTSATKSLQVTPVLAVGSHTIAAEYSGTNDYGPSSAGLGINVLPDTGVALTKVVVTPTTFYPYRDSYLDYVTIGGTLDELATVSIAVYSSSGHRVARSNLGTRSGAYAYRWTGRSSTGSILPAGRYRVVQTLHDLTGHALATTAYVTLSTKRLYTQTVTLTKSARQYAKRAASWIGWQFSIPSATIYRSMTLRVYGVTGVPPAVFGAWDFRSCSAAAPWSPSCVSRTRNLSYTLGWASLGLSTVNNRSGHLVRAFVFAPYLSSGAVSMVALKVTFGILR